MQIPELNEGETNAGIIMLPGNRGLAPHHWVILLPKMIPSDENWRRCIEWAKDHSPRLGSYLGDRWEHALLYANARDQIDNGYWYWTATKHDHEPAWAWLQFFLTGDQYDDLKDLHYRARAVRRVLIG